MKEKIYDQLYETIEGAIQRQIIEQNRKSVTDAAASKIPPLPTTPAAKVKKTKA